MCRFAIKRTQSDGIYLHRTLIASEPITALFYFLDLLRGREEKRKTKPFHFYLFITYFIFIFFSFIYSHKIHFANSLKLDFDDFSSMEWRSIVDFDTYMEMAGALFTLHLNGMKIRNLRTDSEKIKILPLGSSLSTQIHLNLS